MSSKSSETAEFLDELEETLTKDPSANPFQVAALILKQQLYPPVPESFEMQLFILSGVLGLALVLALVTMGVRYFKGASMSLFRMIPTARGTFICPQTSTSFSLFTGIFLVLTQGHIWATYRVAKDSASEINFILWKSLIWYPLYITLVFETWGTLITTLMSSHAQNKRSSTSFRPYVPPAFINAFFITVIIMATIPIFSVFIVSSVYFNKAFNQFVSIENLLAASAASYDPSDFSITELITLLPVMDPFLDNINRFILYFRIGYSFWIAFPLIMIIIYLPTAYFYIKTLRYQISALQKSNSLKFIATETKLDRSLEILTADVASTFDPARFREQERKPKRFGGGGGGMSKAAREERKRLRRKRNLSMAYKNLIYSCLATLFGASFYTVLCTYIVVDPTFVLQDPKGFQFESLTSLYIYAVLGIIANFLTLVRTINSKTFHKPTSRSDNITSTEGSGSKGTSAGAHGARPFNPAQTTISISAFDPPPPPPPAPFMPGVPDYETLELKDIKQNRSGWDDDEDDDSSPHAAFYPYSRGLEEQNSTRPLYGRTAFAQSP